MQRFLGLVLLVFLGIGCVWIPSGTPSTQSLTDKNLLWFNPEGCYLPCIWNIVPGETSIDEAIRIIERTVPPEQVVDAGQFWITDADGNQIYIEVTQSDPRSGSYVRQIEVNGYINGEIASLDDFLDAGYFPSQVFRNEVNGPAGVSLFILFNDGHTAVEVYDDFISADSPIAGLIVRAEGENEYLISGNRPYQEFFVYEITWIGFASPEDYLNLESVN